MWSSRGKSFQQMVLKLQDSYRQNNALWPELSLHEPKAKRIMVLKIKCKTHKTVKRKNHGELGLGKELLHSTPETWPIKGSVDKLDLIKHLMLCKMPF
jgi:hypothetical protein